MVVTIRRSWAHLQAIKLGRDGERAVGQYLDQLRESGARVFHDIVGQGFNVDHVVVAAQGIFRSATNGMVDELETKHLEGWECPL